MDAKRTAKDRFEMYNSGWKKKGLGVCILLRQNEDIRESSNGENAAYVSLEI